MLIEEHLLGAQSAVDALEEGDAVGVRAEERPDELLQQTGGGGHGRVVYRQAGPLLGTAHLDALDDEGGEGGGQLAD